MKYKTSTYNTHWQSLKQHFTLIKCVRKQFLPWQAENQVFLTKTDNFNPLSPLLPYRYSYKAPCARPAIICNFWHMGTLTLSRERQSAHMSKSYKWWLNPVWHWMQYSCTHMATVGIKRLKHSMWQTPYYSRPSASCCSYTDVLEFVGRQGTAVASSDRS